MPVLWCSLSVNERWGLKVTGRLTPQIRRSEPGICPICGMTLEPEGIPEAEAASPRSCAPYARQRTDDATLGI
jgi:hypothetical protein